MNRRSGHGFLAVYNCFQYSVHTFNFSNMMRTIAITILILFSSYHSIYCQNINISEGFVFDGEPYLAVNPSDNQHLIIAWMGFELSNNIAIQIRTSMNGGTTWSPAIFLPHSLSGNTSADPFVGFDSEGHAYITYIDYQPDASQGAVFMVHSEDGGLTWSDPVSIIDVDADPGEFPVDRPWTAIDRTGGIYDGYIYVCTKPAPWEPAPNEAYFLRSTDMGATWETWQYIDTPGFSIGNAIQGPMAVPAVQQDGSLYIVYPAWEPAENLLPRFVLAKSTDGGATFSYTEMLESGESISDTLPKLGYNIQSDPSDAQHLSFLFIAPGVGDQDVFILDTYDGGVTWSAPYRVNQDPEGNGIMQDLIWGAYNAEGDLVVTWRDRNAGGTAGYETPTEILASIRRSGETAFSPAISLSDAIAPHAPVLNGNGNDFMCAAFVADTIYAAWGDVRSGMLNIWFTKTAPDATLVVQLNAANNLLVTPNPAVAGTLLQTDIVAGSYQLYDIKGRLIFSGDVAIGIPTNGLTPGNYILQIKQEGTLQQATLVIQ
ncbi:MAG TPA: hypothetical protein DHW15_13325 [Bacteroidetes bacterium]|jgi:hypothetical protein|nr:hypothetical protein [Bacteroidota bacterium]